MNMLQKGIKPMPMQFMNRPENTISGKTLSKPLPYAKAFGGVALGSMNAHEQASVAGIKPKFADLVPIFARIGSCRGGRNGQS